MAVVGRVRRPPQGLLVINRRVDYEMCFTWGGAPQSYCGCRRTYRASRDARRFLRKGPGKAVHSAGFARHGNRTGFFTEPRAPTPATHPIFYCKSNNDTAINAIPLTMPYMQRWCSPYSSAVGKSSSKEMNTMIPATAPNSRPKTPGEKKGIKTK